MIPDDPLYPAQWHLPLLGDIEAVWTRYSGAGVTVGVYDDGIDYAHADLRDGYDAGRHVTDASGAAVDPFPLGDAAHGTAAAGLIGATAGNGRGGTGVAPGVALTGVNIFREGLYGHVNGAAPGGEAAFLDVVRQAARFDVMSNSWGSRPDYAPVQSQLAAASDAAARIEAYAFVAATGRGGLGTVVVQAAGNDGRNANGDGLNASRHTITVAATDQAGDAEDFSNWGAGILVAAPAAAVTTDATGARGYGPGDYMRDFGGTSAAAPLTAGVIALMLEADPGLGWRDVHDILAASARQTGSAFGAPSGPEEAGAWASNGAATWNGGGHAIHASYGYGMLDAFAATRMAEIWAVMAGPAGTSADERTVTAESGLVGRRIRDLATLADTISVPDAGGGAVEIDTISVTIDVSHDYAADLVVDLVSPHGTRFGLMRNEGGASLMDSGFEWLFEVTGARGTTSAGDWTLEIADTVRGDDGVLWDWRIDFHGSPADADDVHHLTADYRALAAVEPGRATIDDANGGADWLNAAAIADDLAVDLAAGGFGARGGAAWGAVGAGIEHVMAGDGDDLLTGSGGINRMLGRRGADTLNGGGGADSLRGGAGADRVIGDGGDDLVAGDGGDDLVGGAGGDDRAYGGAGDDRVFGGPGDDRLHGGPGSDGLHGSLGDDTVLGETGDDRLLGHGGADLLGGGPGDDVVRGGRGDDRVFGATGADTVLGDAGADTVLGGGGRDLVGGGAGDDLLGGGHGDDRVHGAGGRDALYGAGGRDRLSGGAGADTLAGGAGADVFAFSAVADSTAGGRDRILDFAPGADRIDLAAIDADPARAGDQAFAFVGGAAFGGAGAELRFATDGADGFVLGDVDGDRAQDLVILLAGVIAVSAGDFVL